MPAIAAALVPIRCWRPLLDDVRAPSRHLRIVLAAVLLGLGSPVAARAQLVGAATVESQYRPSGVSLTDSEPDLRLSLSYDYASGAYAGGSVIGAQTARDGLQAVGYVAYAGFAKQAANGLVWDVGVTNSDLTLYLPAQRTVSSAQGMTYPPGYNPSTGQGTTRRYGLNYSELYGGVSLSSLSAHLYLSPDYLGQNLKTAYLDVTETIRPINRLRLYAHVGALTSFGGAASPGRSGRDWDLRAGAAWEFHRGEIQLAWTRTEPQVEYPFGYRQARDALIVSLTGFF